MSINTDNEQYTDDIQINPNINNLYELLYINTSGNIFQVKKNLWIDTTITKFDGINDNVTAINPLVIVSKITQLNTGDFLFLGKDCNIYKMSFDLKNPIFISDYKYTSLTQLSNYKILLTNKDGKMYIVDDVHNFDSTTSLFFDDGTMYCSIKQTSDGFIIGIDGDQCGTAWRFELIDNQLMNKTKINLDETFTNRVTLFTPDQKTLINLNCNSRHIDRIYKYDYSDQIIKTNFDFRCDEDEEYEGLIDSCFKKCPTGYSSKDLDYISCWENCGDNIDVGDLCRKRCKDGYKDISGVCWLDKKLTYDVGVGVIPNYSCPEGYDLEGVKCIKKPPDGYKRLPGDYTTYWLDEPTSKPRGSKSANQDNSACNNLVRVVSGVGSCSGWDECNSRTPVVCTKLCKSCAYDSYTWGCDIGRCGQDADVCAGGCVGGVVSSGGACSWEGCCTKTARTCTPSGTCCDWDWAKARCKRKCGDNCVGGDCIGCARCEPVVSRWDDCAWSTPKTCSPGPAKCCNNGIKTSLIAANCDACGSYDSCTGNDCIGAAVTRNAPRTCPTGYSFDSGDPLKIGLCYNDCPDGYETRPGDIVSCWNKKPTSKVIPPENTINANISCSSDREYRDLMCYKKCDEGYVAAATNCSIPADVASYVPVTYAKKTLSRGNATGAGIPKPINCEQPGEQTSECCRFDLAFYNPAFVKPMSMVLPQIPIIDGLIGYYDASSFRNGVWYDLSSNNNHVTQIKGFFNVNNLFISGTVNSTILFPYQILPKTYTVFNLSKYTNQFDTETGGKYGRILSGFGTDWFSGFNNGLSGVSGRDKPITQNTFSAFDNNWVFSTDTNNSYHANSTDYTIKGLTDLNKKNVLNQLSINLNIDPVNNSNFSIGYVIVFNRTLSDSEIFQFEKWLQNTYSELFNTTWSKTFAQLGYSCFNGLVGKVTNDYSNYSFATYGDQPISCDLINLPVKNDFDPLLCLSNKNYVYNNQIKTEIETENEIETFTNLIDYYIPNEIFYLLIILFFIVLLTKKK